MATELIAIEDGQRTAVKPIYAQRGPSGEPIEPIEAVQNAGEFPTLTEQAEGRYPGLGRDSGLARRRVAEIK